MTKTADQEASDQEFREGLKRGRVFVSWRLLRSIGNSRAAKLTILIPLIGYLILLNDTVIKHLELSEEVFGAPSGAKLTSPSTPRHITAADLLPLSGRSGHGRN